jgi:hypothetical protein
MKPKVYLETTIPSVPTSRPSRDVEIAAQQFATREWWDTRRSIFELFISPEVLGEVSQGDSEAARLRLQATSSVPAYCYAYYKCSVLPGIDAFILHRHVDHGGEGGLKLGLWTRDEMSSSPSRPLRKKMVYEVFRRAGTPEWEKAFAFALPVIGITNWHQFDPPP